MGPPIIFDAGSRAALGRRVTQRGLNEFAAILQKRVSKGLPFNCMIAGDDELRRLNKQFRKKNQATDVLSFPADHSISKEKLIGELAISADRALEQSREYGHSIGDEIKILMLHGVLHLTGLDHEVDAGEMARTETRWRKTLGLPTGLIERTRS